MNSDVCCWACRSPTGVCLTRRTCEHHLKAERAENADDQARKLYNNPTQDRAIANVMRSQRRKG